MTKNVGGIGRILRIVIGAALILGFFSQLSQWLQLALSDRDNPTRDRPDEHLPAL